MHINKDILMVGLGLLLICLGAMVSIDLPWKDGGIPITGQSLAVLVVGFVLGPKRGLLVIAIYLIAGLAGLPVFAKGASGIDTLMGGSGGFLYGFLVGGYDRRNWWHCRRRSGGLHQSQRHQAGCFLYCWCNSPSR